MNKLTIDEIIEHCKRKTARYEQLNGIKTLENADISNNFIKEYWEHRQVAEYLEEIQQYRAIGTVEECREARERQSGKKPLSRTHCKDGNHPLSQDIGRCPSCNSIVAEDMFWCDDCGQKLDWSDTP